MTARRWLGFLLALVVLAVTACGDDDDQGSSAPAASGADKPQLTVSAAASLKTAFENYGKQFDAADVKFSFAGSDELAAQIEQGVKPDVYAAANTKLPDELYEKGLVEQPVVFAGNELVLAVPADSDIDSIDDLTEEGVTIAIGQEDVPVGSYTRTVLEKLPAEQSEAIMANVKTEEPDVAGITGKLTQGAVDAGFLYVSDVRATDGELKAVTLPEDLQPEVAYGTAVVKGAKEPEIAQQFIDGLLNGAGAEALKEAGFEPPPAQ
jgi:molybdate transport system substrate-binding protein